MMLNESCSSPVVATVAGGGVGGTAAIRSSGLSRNGSGTGVIIPLPRPNARRNGGLISRHSIPAAASQEFDDEGYKQSVLIATGQAYPTFSRQGRGASLTANHRSSSPPLPPVTIDTGYQPFVPAGDPDQDREAKRRLSATVAVAVGNNSQQLTVADRNIRTPTSDETRQILTESPDADKDSNRSGSISSPSIIEERLEDDDTSPPPPPTEDKDRSKPQTQSSRAFDTANWSKPYQRQVAKLKTVCTTTIHGSNAAGNVTGISTASLTKKLASGPSVKNWARDDEDNLLDEACESDEELTVRKKPPPPTRALSQFSPPIPPRKNVPIANGGAPGEATGPTSGGGGGGGGDLWAMSPDQKEYYTKQFNALQKDLSGKLTGPSARDFFEKSKLHQVELSNIWRLSDVDADGCLTLDEFCTAMHLVVLRRHGVIVPAQLPSSLKPKSSIPPAAAAAVGLPIVRPRKGYVGSPPTDSAGTIGMMESGVQKSISAPLGQNSQLTISPDGPVSTLTNSGGPMKSSTMSSPKEESWTKFNDDDDQASQAKVEVSSKDLKIVHPVPIRLSPDGHPVLHPSLFQHANQPRNHTVPGPNFGFKSLQLVENNPIGRRSSITDMKAKDNQPQPNLPPPPPPPQVDADSPIVVSRAAPTNGHHHSHHHHHHIRSSSLDSTNADNSISKQCSKQQQYNNNSSQDPSKIVNSKSDRSICPARSSAFTAYSVIKESPPQPPVDHEVLLMSLAEEDDDDDDDNPSVMPPQEPKATTHHTIQSTHPTKPWLEMLMTKYKPPSPVPLPSDVNNREELLKTMESWQDTFKHWKTIHKEMLEELINALEAKDSLESQLELLKL